MLVNGLRRILPDIKMSQVKDPYLGTYTREIHAYGYCLENPAHGFLALRDIDEDGLLVYEPESFTNIVPGRGSPVGALKWVKLEIDKPAFMMFLEEVATLLVGPMPEAAPDCEFASSAANPS